MKKIMFFAAAFAAVALASCGNGEKAEGTADSDTIDVVEAATEVIPVDTVGDSIQAVVETAVEGVQAVVPATDDVKKAADAVKSAADAAKSAADAAKALGK